jgi:phosphoribosylamine--glycine ligase
MRLKSDLLDALEAVVDERLDQIDLEWDTRPSTTVVMASAGYPGHYERDHPIQNLEAADRVPGVKVFHAGTTLRTSAGAGRESRIVNNGGRVLNVTALGSTLEEARERSYQAVRTIRFPGGFYRSDIAAKIEPRPDQDAKTPSPPSKDGGRASD